ncbi:kinesin-like protein [Achlya hypogyna]|uniref:Kinesin-like protein n=1 Tax=Achlya hypogyna TaxID=1202772 RepID=A0A1V9YCV0_ACHHY|nr:kinesin-like protein [Achlya hypogyna]
MKSSALHDYTNSPRGAKALGRQASSVATATRALKRQAPAHVASPRRVDDDDDRDSISSHSSSLSNRYGSNFKVVIRVRPPLPRELQGDKPFQNVVTVDSSGHYLSVSDSSHHSTPDDPSNPSSYSNHSFSFDHVYDQHSTQRAVYENTAKAVVESSLEGYNATIFAYGQTGTGKTYTMEGFNSSGGSSLEDRGIIPRAIEQIFMHIQANVSARMRFLVRASYLQIYNESISDLLKPERNNLTIREDKKRGVFVEGLSEWVVRSPEEIYGLMERGGAMRATGSTKMNEISSRSHAVFIIIAEQSQTTYVDTTGKEIALEEFTALVNAQSSRDRTKLESLVRQSFKVGKLNLVDLAGSERVRLSGATGQRLEESKKINQSLSALGNVIAALTDARGRQHIPYRDSKLTRILEDSLGGNCKTTMMAMISPALEAIVESLSTLKFANRAKNIKNEARVNEDLDQKSLLRKYERELKRLRAELEEKSRNVVDKRRLLELDEQRRRAEEDKMAAIRALEQRSLEFMLEKEEKKKLEQRIIMLTSQMLMSHQNKAPASTEFSTEDPQFRLALKEQQDRIRKEYECRLADLEKERETIEEEKAQVDRYKQLLLKQRDIMIALTQRLNERDEQIMALQDELDAYDRHQKALEEKLDEKTAQLIHLQRVTMEHNATSPNKNAELIKALGEWGFKQRPFGDGGKQYVPYERPTVYNSKGDNNATPPKDVLLSADEKIAELHHVLEAQTAELGRALKELEEVRSEKVSVEYAMREKMEKHAEARQFARRIAELEAAKAALETATAGHADLHGRCETLTKERRAVQTIMEHKIKALVDAIARASDATLESAGGVDRIGEPAKWLCREVHALQRLVNASIVALRNANANDPAPPPAVPQELPKAPPAANFAPGGLSVEELIQKRRAQMQREKPQLK